MDLNLIWNTLYIDCIEFIFHHTHNIGQYYTIIVNLKATINHYIQKSIPSDY